MGNLTGVFPGPFVGPATRKKYASAVGDFLVAFNALENGVRRAVEIIIAKHEQPDLVNEISADYYLKQLTNLRLLTLGIEGFPSLPYSRLKAINAQRNTLAHGHFDQGLFSESYKVVGRGKKSDITIADIEGYTKEAVELFHELESALVYIWFDNLDEVPRVEQIEAKE